MSLKKVYIYRMTHMENIPHILKHGITHKGSPNANPRFKAIGDSSLIDFRKTKTVKISESRVGLGIREKIILGDFIPFYLGLRTPMLYVIQKGGNFVPNPTSAENIVYCVSSVQKIIDENLTFFFSDGHATNGLSKFYSKTKVFDIEDLVDFKAANAKYWKDENDLDLKRRKEAEFLVKEDIPASCILGFACYNEDAKDKLLKMGILKKRVIVKPNFYFDI
ncbi:type II toxin-antitoxin system toxin DNA ADP-ribosyl transferase DarT [Ulvibacterium marinum]|uniref:DUF4433 domain-containing protein n=1 Tax=Ulvibacterium marinum TaxID=2419782 RepID=A0A3B0CE10_9FLAO|nr:DUF4433 domain-containing protein [Ulvibacterium marinum]RKN82854.1 DUF4433 domain-containing protein [Ulvibacterium marinum]